MRCEGIQPCGTLLTIIPHESLFRARLIKIDVEGAERAVIEPLVPFLAQFSDRTIWALEVSPHFCPGGQADVDWIFEAFCSHGYEAFAILNDYSVKTHLANPRALELVRLDTAPTGQTDIVFLRSAARSG